MHPASSVILFTSASGAGYGVLIWLGIGAALGDLPAGRWFGFATFLISLGLITVGLLASTFHLGHPERAWRAVSQWRTSWLSREGVAALVTYLPACLFGAGWVFYGQNDGVWALLGLVTAVLATVTIACTGMIYASLKTIPRWSNGWVMPIYLVFGIASGALLLSFVLRLFAVNVGWLTWLAAAAWLGAWVLKAGYWRFIDNATPGLTAESATGLGRFGRVRSLETPHTSENYLLKEMGFALARKHSARLRRMALVVGGGIGTLAAIAAAITLGTFGVVFAGIAVLAAGAGIVIERWLFFAEARHAVTLYYGTPAV